MTECPCKLPKSYDDCCGAIIAGTRPAETAEQLMRSRYTAFATATIDYLERSHHPDTRSEFDAEQAEQWATRSSWKSFEVLRTVDGGPDDDAGIVEFVAHYTVDDNDIDHHEISEFGKVDGVWYFRDGQEVPTTVRREGEKVQRNDPCPCGSGKKHKKCCGKA